MPSQISIHALLAESDSKKFPLMCFIRHFYPRSPCGERHFDTLSALAPEEFLSTLSLRRATLEQSASYNAYLISIHALLAESDRNGFAILWNTCISIHALLAESDGILLTYIIGFLEFLSTLSLRRATIRKCQIIPIIQISIHALLAESDSVWVCSAGLEH